MFDRQEINVIKENIEKGLYRWEKKEKSEKGAMRTKNEVRNVK